MTVCFKFPTLSKPIIWNKLKISGLGLDYICLCYTLDHVRLGYIGYRVVGGKHHNPNHNRNREVGGITEYKFNCLYSS